MTQPSLFEHSPLETVPSPAILLVDNGSRRAQAVFGLRQLATELSGLIGMPVEGVSLLHSHKIPPDALDGEPALIVRQRLVLCAERNEHHVIIIPAFIGPSLAITEYLPKVIAEVKADHPELDVTVADTLCGNDPMQPDERLASILYDHILTTGPHPSNSTIAMVDHGSPAKVVNTVRNAIATQLTQRCASRSATQHFDVIASSMERREGEEYAFNEPLLEHIQPKTSHNKRGIAAMLFLLPGRHAGEGGDVAEICQDIVSREVFEELLITPLLSEHPLLSVILRDRLLAVYSPSDTQERHITQYLHLTQVTLPALSQRPTCDWPVSEDHCFQRIVLDTICDGLWYSTIKKPAYLHMSTQQAQQAVKLCIDIIAGRVDIHQLNHQSLVWRDKPR